LTVTDILQILYRLYMRDSSEEIANKYNTPTNSCSNIQLCVMFKGEWPEEEWPIEEVMYLNLIGGRGWLKDIVREFWLKSGIEMRGRRLGKMFGGAVDG
jgi:hypothetical protein